jgi:hypothetical protein
MMSSGHRCGFFRAPFHATTSQLNRSAEAMILLIATIALYGKHLTGSWRWIYVAAAITALYFNVVVLVTQLFQKVPVLQALAPTQSELPFLIAQIGALFVFVILGVIAEQRFHPHQVSA